MERNDLPSVEEVMMTAVHIFPDFCVTIGDIHLHLHGDDEPVSVGTSGILLLHDPQLICPIACQLSKEMLELLIMGLEEIRDQVTWSSSANSVVVEPPSVN